MLHCLSVRENVGLLVSEENKEPVLMRHDAPRAHYAVVFDPLDGSSNIDVSVSVGTIFSILRRPDGAEHADPMSWVLQPGSRQVAAGYVLYGSSTVFVYSAGNGVHGFTLDPAIGAYVLSHENIRMPEQGIYYSCNEANRNDFPPPCAQYLDELRGGAYGRRYSSRYIGSMVADVHRTLLKGGVFLYPPTEKQPSGKLRLMYRRSDCVSRRTSGRSSHERPPANSGYPAAEPARTDAIADRRTARDGGVRAIVRTGVARCHTSVFGCHWLCQC
ncbi:MAG: class 1 fructose-bisphosphatase [Planctomycetaceae bacterium]